MVAALISSGVFFSLPETSSRGTWWGIALLGGTWLSPSWAIFSSGRSCHDASPDHPAALRGRPQVVSPSPDEVA